MKTTIKGLNISFAQDCLIDIKDLDELSNDLNALKKKYFFIADWDLSFSSKGDK